jgi:signal transduction histidine kinase
MKFRALSLDNPEQIFLFLLAYRWASLLPALWLISSQPGGYSLLPPGLLLGIDLFYNLVITLFHKTFNRVLVQRPALLGLDILFTTSLIAASGGTRSPFYLYALSPLLAGAFFFQMRGAIAAAGAFTPLYLAGLLVSQANSTQAGVYTEVDALLTQLAGAWLIALSFGYPSVLLKRLRQAHDDLKLARDALSEQNTDLVNAHQQLRIIHDLAISLQAAPDMQTVQSQVLEVVTRDLGYPMAAVGLVSPGSNYIDHWLVQAAGEQLPASNPGSINLSVEFMDSLRRAEDQKDRPAYLQVLDEPDGFYQRYGPGPWVLATLFLREHLVGVLLISIPEGLDGIGEARRVMLQAVVEQASVALGTTMLCIDRAQRLAVEQERNRIARDIHDTVAQSLFGIVFSLDACTQMLPDQPESVQKELVELRSLASQVRDEVRRSILDLWPAELTLERFRMDLSEYASQCCRPNVFQVEFNSRGDFERLTPSIRRTLFRIAQEALNNVVRHAGVDLARVQLAVSEESVVLSVEDLGRGFDPEKALARKYDQDHFGLLGIRERIRSLAGDIEIQSQPGVGTLLKVWIPLNGENVYA